MNYKRLGDYIERCDEKNIGNEIKILQGISNRKYFQKAKTNTIGIDLSKYRIVRTGQFAFNRATTRNSDRISIALRKGPDCIVSPSYRIFKSKNEEILDSDYLLMWFKRPIFDRYARFKSHGSAHEFFDWDEMCEVELPVPSLEEQRTIVAEYRVVTDRIRLNEKINSKLEEAAQVMYENRFGHLNKSVYLSDLIEINPKHTIKKGDVIPYVEMADLMEDRFSIKGYRLREYKSGSKFMLFDTLLARITPCLENGKTAFVDSLPSNQIAYGSTEFIIMRAKEKVSKYYVYFLARDENFRDYAISSMTGTSGRQRVESNYLKEYKIPELDSARMDKFHLEVDPLFKKMKNNRYQISSLTALQALLLSKMARSKTSSHQKASAL